MFVRLDFVMLLHNVFKHARYKPDFHREFVTSKTKSSHSYGLEICRLMVTSCYWTILTSHYKFPRDRVSRGIVLENFLRECNLGLKSMRRILTVTTDNNYYAIDINQHHRAQVRTWLYVVCFLIFVIVIVGGATRLTDSGLSITEWKPLLGAIPPLNASDWQIAFEKYRLIPEYKLINKGMSLEEFKFIYWWEWGHRFLGRLIGLVVFFPLVFFWIKGRLESWIKPHLLVLFVLGGLQGFIGWWMVSSGLVERVDVSQYRLAAHLTLACIIFAYTMWLARSLVEHSNEPITSKLAIFSPIIVFAVLFQIFLGALVAGLDAGLSYTDWPTMGGEILPSDLWIQTPFWINAFENPKTVQFIHRMSAYALLLLVFVQMFDALKSNVGGTHKRRTIVLMVLTLAQAAIGVITLVLQVPLNWGLYHQGGAIIVLGFAIVHWRAVKFAGE